MIKESDYLVSNQEILGGIRTAVSKGESLKDAMMTFYQAGYDKYEIEEAARAFMSERNSEPQMDVTRREVPVNEKKEEVKGVNSSGATVPFKQTSAVIPQRVSSYEPPKKMTPPKSSALTILLILVLLVLLGILISVFLFREEIVDFFNGLFDFALTLF